jgi:hypothetical protein
MLTCGSVLGNPLLFTIMALASYEVIVAVTNGNERIWQRVGKTPNHDELAKGFVCCYWPTIMEH